MGKFQCDNCGAAMSIDEDLLTATCEYCGTTISIPDTYPEYAEAVVEKKIDEWEDQKRETENKPPFRQKIRLIVTVAVIIIITTFSIIICGVALSISSDKSRYSKVENAEYSWPVTGNAVLLPQPLSGYGEIISDSDSHFSAVIYDVSQNDFDTYAAECREKGFDLASEGSDSSYYAYHADGYCIDLFYWEDDRELSIYLDAPEVIQEFNWPTTGLAAGLPKPISNLGKVIYEDAEEVSILVYVESKNEFDLYVEECKKYGFTEDHEYYFTDNRNGWYEADNKNGCHLDLNYSDRYYKKMEIRLDQE